MTNKDGKYGKILNNVDFDDKGRTIAEAFKGYLGAPHHSKKVKQTVIWLLSEFNIDEYIEEILIKIRKGNIILEI